MHYFVKEEAGLRRIETETFPAELELLYQQVRQKYTIQYKSFDWADDDSDAGMGYCYDNFYAFSREPQREELIIQNGQLIGFYVGPIRRELSDGQILPLKQDARVYISGTCSSRHGSGQEWGLKIEEKPAPCGYVFLTCVPHEDKNKEFLPSDFSGKLVEEVTWRCSIEDSRGHFDDASRFKLKLTPKAIQDPDGVLLYFKEFGPNLVRE